MGADSNGRLKIEIGLKQAALAEERAALKKLQDEVSGFARQYDRIIGPLELQLDTVRQEIEAIQALQQPTRDDGNGLWGGYNSFEESFDAKYRRPQNPTITPPPRKVDETSLRTLYRKLARKYHPDTTTDPTEKARLTLIMAQINAAYRARNLEELAALDTAEAKGLGIKIKVPPPVVEPTENTVLTYADLLKIAQRLDDDIAITRSEQKRLLSSPLMALKIEASIARSQGRDLLREIAAKVRADLDTARAELSQLRRGR